MVTPVRKPKRYSYAKSLGLFLIAYSFLDTLKEYFLHGWLQPDFEFDLAVLLIGISTWFLGWSLEKRWEEPLKPVP